MKRSVFLIASFVLFLCGCGDEAKPPVAAAGLPPVAWIAGRIAGETVPSTLPQGRSPHDYAPQPGEISAITRSGIFFTTHMPFEEKIEKSLRSGKTNIVDVTVGIHRIPMEGGSCTHEHGHDADHSHGHEDGLDPHVWLSPGNSLLIARNIEKALSAAYPARETECRANLEAFERELAETSREMELRLKPFAGRSFFVHHPAFGYFAAAAGLKQSGVELGGRDPSPAKLADIIREAKEHNVKTIFVQPQFNPSAAKSLATAIGGEAVELDPLQADVIANFRRITESIARGFQKQ